MSCFFSVVRKTVTYKYDNNGNQISQQVSFTKAYTPVKEETLGIVVEGATTTEVIDSHTEVTINKFDGFNRLTKVETTKSGVKTITEFVYNGDDLRVRKTVKKSSNNYTPVVTNYLYDRQHVILETDGSDNVKSRYIRGINYIARLDASDKHSYFMYNGHGDVVQTVSEAGVVENSYDYDIWGNPTLTIQQYDCAIRYAGEFYDSETALYYLRARYYNPYTGRFISEDSYWGEDTNPLSLNLYTYCHNDPIMFTDPSGHSPFNPGKLVGGIVGRFVGGAAGKNVEMVVNKGRELGKKEKSIKAAKEIVSKNPIELISVSGAISIGLGMVSIGLEEINQSKQVSDNSIPKVSETPVEISNIIVNKGEKGAVVEELQKMLERIKDKSGNPYFILPSSARYGTFGIVTADSVNKYMIDNNLGSLDEAGGVDIKTWEHIKNNVVQQVVGGSSDLDKSLVQGMEDENVEALQKMLEQLKDANGKPYLTMPENTKYGYFGPSTLKAVNKYKIDKDIKNSDYDYGVVTDSVWKDMRKRLFKQLMSEPVNGKNSEVKPSDNNQPKSSESKGTGKPGEMTLSEQGLKTIADFELSKATIKAWGLGAYDANGNLIGVYPHYVFKKSDNGEWVSDGGITIGYGHYISEGEYNDVSSSERALVDKYAKGAPILPKKIPSNGVAYRVPDSSPVPIAEVMRLYKEDLSGSVKAVNVFLSTHEISLKQHQFDMLVSFSHNYGDGWWSKTNKVLPKFIIEGKGNYDPKEVIRIFEMHSNKERRTQEAIIFNNGYDK